MPDAVKGYSEYLTDLNCSLQETQETPLMINQFSLQNFFTVAADDVLVKSQTISESFNRIARTFNVS